MSTKAAFFKVIYQRESDKDPLFLYRTPTKRLKVIIIRKLFILMIRGSSEAHEDAVATRTPFRRGEAEDIMQARLPRSCLASI